jgi:hypothetical protein
VVREAYVWHNLIMQLVQEDRTREAVDALMRQEELLKTLREGRMLKEQ